MTTVAQFQQAGMPINPEKIRDALRAARGAAPRVSTGASYLKLGQEGSPTPGLITYGIEAVEVQEGSEWVINWQTLSHGFFIRDGAQINEEVLVPVFEPLPRDQIREPRGKETLANAYQCHLVCVSGEDEGTAVEFSGANRGIAKLFTEVLLPSLDRQLDVDPSKLYPVVTMSVNQYDSVKQKRTIYEMVFRIVRWLGDGDTPKPTEAPGDGEPPPMTDAEVDAQAAEAETAEAETLDDFPDDDIPMPGSTPRTRRRAAAPPVTEPPADPAPDTRPASRRRRRTAQ